jgi:hypothetical protein
MLRKVYTAIKSFFSGALAPQIPDIFLPVLAVEILEEYEKG